MARYTTTAQVLRAYSEGLIGPQEAIQATGGLGYSHLFDAMARHDLPLPKGKGREEETEREVREGLPILRQLLGRPDGGEEERDGDDRSGRKVP